MADNQFGFLDKPEPTVPPATPQEARDSALPPPVSTGAGSFAFLDAPPPSQIPAGLAPETADGRGFSFLNKPAAPPTGAPVGAAPTVSTGAVDPEKQSWIGKA